MSGNTTVEFIGLSTLMLAARNTMIAGTLTGSAALAPTALVATIAWASFTPMDDELNRAIEGWNHVQNSLGADGLQGSVTNALQPLSDGWKEGDDRQAFDTWMQKFHQDVTKAGDAAKTNSDALQKVMGDLDKIQLTFAGVAALNLFLMIDFEALQYAPYVGPIFAALLQAQGAIQSASTLSTVAAVLAVLKMGIEPLSKLFLERDTTFSNEVKQGGDYSFADTNANALTWAPEK
jgi:hypothetical protein